MSFEEETAFLEHLSASYQDDCIVRAGGFHNEVFQTPGKVMDRLCDTICNLTAEVIRSITGRSWIMSCFNQGLVL